MLPTFWLLLAAHNVPWPVKLSSTLCLHCQVVLFFSISGRLEFPLPIVHTAPRSVPPMSLAVTKVPYVQVMFHLQVWVAMNFGNKVIVKILF